MSHLTLCRPAGIALKLHWTMLLFGAWMVMGGHMTATFLLTILASVTVHEFAHALVGKCYGIDTDEIVLYPFGGLAFMSRRPETVMSDVWITIAGPCSNLAVAMLALCWGFVDEAWPYDWVREAFIINGMMFMFNLLPLYPMDGGRLLRCAFLGVGVGDRAATTATAGLTVAMSGLLAGIGLIVGDLAGAGVLLVVGLMAALEVVRAVYGGLDGHGERLRHREVDVGGGGHLDGLDREDGRGAEDDTLEDRLQTRPAPRDQA